MFALRIFFLLALSSSPRKKEARRKTKTYRPVFGLSATTAFTTTANIAYVPSGESERFTRGVALEKNIGHISAAGGCGAPRVVVPLLSDTTLFLFGETVEGTRRGYLFGRGKWRSRRNGRAGVDRSLEERQWVKQKQSTRWSRRPADESLGKVWVSFCGHPCRAPTYCLLSVCLSVCFVCLSVRVSVHLCMRVYVKEMAGKGDGLCPSVWWPQKQDR